MDLCAAPGSWSQVLSRTLYKRAVDGGETPPPLVAVDLQPMAPIEGVKLVQGDITNKPTIDHIISLMPSGGADAVLSDGAPDVTGLHDLDEYIQSQILLSALAVSVRVLNAGGTFVAKVFRGRDISLLYAQLRLLFPEVYCAKPRSSRNSSVEAYVVCRNFSPPDDLDTQHLWDELESVAFTHAHAATSGKAGESEWASALVPFVSCGDLSGLDSDMSYSLATDTADELTQYAPGRDDVSTEEARASSRSTNTGLRPLRPVQPPIEPPYKHAVELKRKQYQQ